MTERRALHRLELALGGLGATVALLAFVVALDTIGFHRLALEPQLALAALDAVVISRALASLIRRLRAERAFLRRLPVLRTETIHGHAVRVVGGDALAAFCAGLWGPAVYVTEGTLREAADAELKAILAHEEHHRTRRDPLRLLFAQIVSDALRPLPPFATLAEREEALADLLADAASVDALGNRSSLASAFVRFDTVAPERVDRLVGAWPGATVHSGLLVAAGLALAAIAALVAPMVLAGRHPHVALEPALLLLACVPACLAARRAGACLRPAS